MSAAKGGRFRLLVKEGSSEWEFYTDKKSFTLGRTPKSDICIPMQILSSLHLEITHVDGNKWYVTDKKSTNGTFIQTKKLDAEKPYQVTSPFNLRIGQKTELLFQITDLVEGNLAPVDAIKTKELPKDHDPYQEVLAKSKDDVEKSRREIEKNLQEIKELNDQKNKEAYALTHRLESLRKEAEAAEKRKSHLEKDAIDLERGIQEKTELKSFLGKEVVELQRKIAQLAEQESEAKKSIEVFKSEAQVYKNEKEQSRRALDEVNQKRESSESELASLRSALEEAKLSLADQENKLKEALAKESEAHAELHKSLKLIAEKEAQLSGFNEKFESAKRLAKEKESEFEELNLKVDSLKRSKQQEEKDFQALQSKVQAIKESMQLVESQRKTSEAAVDTLRAELLAAEGKLKRVNAETHELEDRATKLRSEVNGYTHKNQELEESVRRLQESEANLKSEHESHLSALKAELEHFESEEKERIRTHLVVSKNEYERWEKEERERVNLELKTRKDDMLNWENAEREKLQKQFSSQGEKLEKDLAERKQKELLAIDELRNKWNKERDAKRPLEVKEIVRSSADILGAHLLSLNVEADKKDAFIATFKKDLEGVVKSVLISGQGAQVETHLKAALVQSPEETLKAAKKRRMWAIQGGSVLAMLLICLIFPSIPRGAWDMGSSVFRRDPQSADAFVERIRQARLNRPKFMPQRDRVYRNTYTDNIIYLEDYSEIKNDPDIKKQWTLALNKFFVEQLDMDERIIVTFMAIESPLVRELTEMASKIQVKHQETDISSMRAFEDLSTPRLIEAVKGRANYDKFRQFELKFYDEYSNKLNVPPATP